MTTATADRMSDVEFQHEFLSRADLPAPNDVITVVDEYLATRQKTLVAAIDLGIGDNGMGEIKNKAATAFMKRWMMLKFATVDLSFTENRKWWLKLERDQHNNVKVTESYNVEPHDVEAYDPAFATYGCIDRYFNISQDLHEFAFSKMEDHTASQKAGFFAPSRKKGESMRGTEIAIHAAVPDGIGQKQVNVARQALSHYHMSRALLYSRGIDLLEELTGENKYRYGDNHGLVFIIWSPNREVLTATSDPPRPEGDPAIILQLHGQSYLLDFYDTPDETPIINLIREFSDGKLPK